MARLKWPWAVNATQPARDLACAIDEGGCVESYGIRISCSGALAPPRGRPVTAPAHAILDGQVWHRR